MQVQPQGARLYIERIIESADAVKGQVHYEDEDFKAPQSLKVEVLAVGQESLGYSVGDVLLVSQFAPTEVKVNPGDKHKFIIPAEDVLAIVEPVKAAK